jgi:hypothetical protein
VKTSVLRKNTQEGLVGKSEGKNKLENLGEDGMIT